MMIFRSHLDQRGDTLVEVTIALAIMAAVLTSAFLLAEKSIQIGRIAKERTLMVAAAQQQAEALTAYRDRFGWASFVANVRGSLTTICSSSRRCFTIAPANSTVSALSAGEGSVGTVPTSKLYITTDINSPTAPNPVTFTISYSAEPPGGGALMSSEVILQLGNTDKLRSKVVGR